MFFALILVATLGALSDEPSFSPSKPDIASYNETAAKTGENAEAQVRLALWCEARLMTAERLKHLSLAVLYEPKNSLARGLMGLVAYQGKWELPEQVSQEAQDNRQQKARIKEYLDRRSKAPDRAEDQWRLALWCEQNGLKQQAQAHLHRVVQLDPKRESAWKHLGYKRVGTRWIKPDEAAAAKVEAQRQKKASDHWRPILERLRVGLQSKDALRRADAEKTLAHITDRWSVPMVWATFGRGNASLQKVAVQVLGQIDDASASRSLVMLAVFCGSADIRRLAIETLRRRDAREFAALLIAMIQRPIKYTVKKVGGPGQPGELLSKGQGSTPDTTQMYPPSGDANGQPRIRWQWRQLNVWQVRRVNHVIVSASEQSFNFGSISFSSAPPQYGLPMDDTSTPVVAMINGQATPAGQLGLPGQTTASGPEQQLQRDIDAIVKYNSSLSETNDRVVAVLNEVSGQKLGPDTVAWQTWLGDVAGVHPSQPAEPRATAEKVSLEPQSRSIPAETLSGPGALQRVSCFGAGTMVQTLTGKEPIESVSPGDQVLTQSTKTGAMSYKPIITLHHDAASKTYEIKLGDETIVSSQFHRFWKPGSGWVMARDLKVGDPIRTLNGTTKVTAIEDGRVVPVFNLEVADAADFFIGETGALTHDNTLPDLREAPFDAVAVPGHSDRSSRGQVSGEGKP